MTTFICPPQELPAEKVRQIVCDAGCNWPEDDSRESRVWRFNVRRIVEAAWHRGFADHADHAAAPELLTALKKVAQSLEWYAHGRCRGFDEDAPLPTGEAVEVAKRTIAKALGHDG